jgi:hypothetical protein
MKLSILAILLGAALGAPQVYGLAKPKKFIEAVRKFPRNYMAGVVLMLLATFWFVWNLQRESLAEFEHFKPHLTAFAIALGFACCVFVKDFLAVRGLAVVFLLLAKLMVDTGRPHLGETPFVLVIQIWAYVLVIAGIWFTVTPWHLRDFLNWATASEKRVRIGSGIRLAFAVFELLLGLTAFKGM